MGWENLLHSTNGMPKRWSRFKFWYIYQGTMRRSGTASATNEEDVSWSERTHLFSLQRSLKVMPENYGKSCIRTECSINFQSNNFRMDFTQNDFFFKFSWWLKVWVEAITQQAFNWNSHGFYKYVFFAYNHIKHRTFITNWMNRDCMWNHSLDHLMRWTHICAHTHIVNAWTFRMSFN